MYKSIFTSLIEMLQLKKNRKRVLGLSFRRPFSYFVRVKIKPSAREMDPYLLVLGEQREL